MSHVRFATVCDLCGKRGEEYVWGSSCEECGADICSSCTSQVIREADEDMHEVALCNRCDLIPGTAAAIREELGMKEVSAPPTTTDVPGGRGLRLSSAPSPKEVAAGETAAEEGEKVEEIMLGNEPEVNKEPLPYQPAVGDHVAWDAVGDVVSAGHGIVTSPSTVSGCAWAARCGIHDPSNDPGEFVTLGLRPSPAPCSNAIRDRKVAAFDSLREALRLCADTSGCCTSITESGVARPILATLAALRLADSIAADEAGR